MKRFFNLSTGTMLAAIAIAVIAAVLSSTINWQAVIWMVIAAMWVVCARWNQMMSEDWKQLYDSNADELAKLRDKYQALDNDYLKLAKRNEATSKENAQESGLKPRRKKKLDLTDEDVTRIKMEMHTAGLIKEEE